MKRIAVLSNTFPPHSGGGVATAQYNILKKLQHSEFIVKGFTFYDHGINEKTEDITRCGSRKFIFRTINTFFKNYFNKKDNGNYAWNYNFIINSAIGCWKINKELEKFKPDIIIVPDLGCSSYFIKKPKNSKIIFISHHNPMRFIDNPLIGNYSVLDAKLANSIENKALKNVDKVVCPSKYMKIIFEDTHIFDGPIGVIANIVDEKLIETYEKINIKNEMGLNSNDPLIYIPLAGAPVKGAKYVFEVIRRLATFYKKPIGFYLSAGISAQLTYELDFLPENVKIYAPGYLDYQKNIGIIKACSFGISPTLLESFGMAILESHICGVPMVSFDVGGNTDIITNGEDGFLVEYMDIEDLIDKSQKLLNNSDLVETMSNRAQMNAISNFNSNVTVQKLISFILD